MKLFLLSGYPRYCTATTLPDGTTVLNGGRSRRGKPRGPPGSRELQTALKGCDDPLFLDFIRRCLEWDPATRMTPNAALRHAWLRRRLPRPPQVFAKQRFWSTKKLHWRAGKSVSGNSLLIGTWKSNHKSTRLTANLIPIQKGFWFKYCSCHPSDVTYAG